MKKQKIRVNNTDFTYYQKGEGRPLVLFHGGAIRAKTYLKIIDLLSETYTVYAPDLPGHAGTGLTSDIKNYDDVGKLFSDFIEKLQLNDVILTGHSFGGGTCLATAKYSDKVKELVLVASAGLPLNYSAGRLLWGFFFKSYYGSFRYGMWKHYFFANNEQNATLFPHFLKIFKVMSFLIKNTLGGVDKIENLEKKCLILWGDNDEIFNLKYAKNLDAKLRNSTLEIYPGNHDLFFYKPEMIVERINIFLS